MDISTLYQIFCRCNGVTTDSRQCPEGSLFIALKGDTFNGNAFAAKALESGCAYAVIDEAEYLVPSDDRYLLTDNCIVKIDDLGYWLAEKSSALMQALGKGLLIIAPWLMKALSIVGTLAMFLVGGGIVVHGIAPLHHAIEHFAGQQSAVVAMILPTVLNLILGFIIGGIVVLGVKAVAKIRGQAH